MSQEFTFSQYREILLAARGRFEFLRFGNAAGAAAGTLWRHDVDFSPQRALAMARLEAELGVVSSYFIQLSSRYYNIFEPEICGIFREISACGHELGLHFDAEVCAHLESPDYERRLVFEAQLLSEHLDTAIEIFSLHNPTTLVGNCLDSATHAGLLNASCATWRDQFTYCSDSNGIWRYRALREVIDDDRVQKLYALTHPEWWQETPQAPRARIQRCIDGRAAFCERYYDGLLSANDRPNVGHEEI